MKTSETIIKNIPSDEILKEAAKRYALYVRDNRAFSEVCDGLKPSQRAIMWTAYFVGMHKDASYVRSAKIIGTVIGHFHPHGDLGVYEVLCKMTKHYIQRPYFDAEANFGDRQSPPAASRYTQARLSDYGKLFLYEDYIKSVPTVPSYDAAHRLPLYLPCLVPNLLINGSGGIGYGSSAFIPPFTVESLRPLIRKAILGKSFNVKNLEFNFMFGGNHKLLDEKYFETGRGSVRMTPVREVTRDKYVLKNTYFLPNPETLEKKLQEDPLIGSFYEMSKSTHNLNFEINFKGAAKTDPKLREEVVARLDSLFTDSVTLITSWLVGPSDAIQYEDDDLGKMQFRSGNISDIVQSWADYRVDLEGSRLERLWDNTKQGLDYQKLLLKAALNVDKVFAVISQKKLDRKAMAEKLADSLVITTDQANEILGMAVYRLSAMEKTKIEEKIIDLRTEISNIKDKLNDLPNHTASVVDKHMAGVLTSPVDRSYAGP